jgi:hypothetical protein
MAETVLWPWRPACEDVEPRCVDPGWLEVLPEDVRPSEHDDPLWWRVWSPTLVELWGLGGTAPARVPEWSALTALDRGAVVRCAGAVRGVLACDAGAPVRPGAPCLGASLSTALLRELREMPGLDGARRLLLGAAAASDPDAARWLSLRFPPADGDPWARPSEPLARADARLVGRMAIAALAGYPMAPAGPARGAELAVAAEIVA